MTFANTEHSEVLCAIGDFSELERIRNFIKGNAMEFGFDTKTAEQLSLAVDEACSNLICHSYNFDKSKKICIKTSSNDKEFVINIFDEGKPFNPIQMPQPDMNEYFSKPKRGGLGIHIIKLLLDEISYSEATNEQKCNSLCLKKYKK